ALIYLLMTTFLGWIFLRLEKRFPRNVFGRLSPLGSDGFFLAVYEYPVGFICLQGKTAYFRSGGKRFHRIKGILSD
ncbi:hypothetical protein, partial [Neisseria meningitidis]